MAFQFLLCTLHMADWLWCDSVCMLACAFTVGFYASLNCFELEYGMIIVHAYRNSISAAM